MGTHTLTKPAKVNFTKARKPVTPETTVKELTAILRARKRVAEFYLAAVLHLMQKERVFAWETVFHLDDPTKDEVIFRHTWDDGHFHKDTPFKKADLEAL